MREGRSIESRGRTARLIDGRRGSDPRDPGAGSDESEGGVGEAGGLERWGRGSITLNLLRDAMRVLLDASLGV
jgi:hypothetical protein